MEKEKQNMSFVCPQCGYVEYNWRPKTWDTTCGDWLCRVSEIEQFNPILAERLKKEHELTDNNCAYKISKTGVWVIRRWIQIFKVQGWKNIPAEKVIKNKLAQHVQQAKLLEVKT
jgi:hypothetical protein